MHGEEGWGEAGSRARRDEVCTSTLEKRRLKEEGAVVRPKYLYTSAISSHRVEMGVYSSDFSSEVVY